MTGMPKSFAPRRMSGPRLLSVKLTDAEVFRRPAAGAQAAAPEELGCTAVSGTWPAPQVDASLRP